MHLSPGIAVTEGQAVKRKDLLGKSGFTGYNHSSHLHFMVGKLDQQGKPLSIPIRFRSGTETAVISPWNLRVSEDGLVAARPSYGFSILEHLPKESIVTIVYQVDGVLAYRDIVFEVTDVREQGHEEP